MRKLIVLTALLLASNSSWALWVPFWTSGNVVGTVAYNGASASVTETMISAGGSKGPLGTLASAVGALPNSIKTSLDANIRNAAAGVTDGSLAFVSSSISRGFTARIEGLTGSLAGLNRLSFSGLSYLATLTASGDWHGLSYRCSVTVHATNIALAVVYAPYSGQIDPTNTTIDPHIVHGEDCSTIFDPIPILGDIMSRVAERFAKDAVNEKLNGFSTAALAAIIPYGPQYLGIYNAVPTGAYVVGNVDIGQYLRDNFASLFTGRALTFSVGPRLDPPPNRGGIGDPAPVTLTSSVFTIDLSDANTKLSFSLTMIDRYSWQFYCPPPGGCHLP